MKSLTEICKSVSRNPGAARYVTSLTAFVVAAVALAQHSPESDYNLFAGPWVFSGYREVSKPAFEVPATILNADNWRYDRLPEEVDAEQLLQEMTLQAAGEIAAALEQDADFAGVYELMSAEEREALLMAAANKKVEDYLENMEILKQKQSKEKEALDKMAVVEEGWLPDWLRTALVQDRIARNLMYTIMVEVPTTIDYAYWNLPVPPRLPEEDRSLGAYIKSMGLPEFSPGEKIATEGLRKVHWLHNAMAGIQFSQAYVSANWYQGGNDYLALLLNALWDVQLNTVYHPNTMFQSTVSYKLGINSTPPDSYHKYSISEDLFQWNLKAGLKAFNDFFWSYNLLFKTQLLRNYEANSDTRLASFLSPGELNMGIGMSYSYANKYKTLKVGVSLSPLSYNLKTCIDPEIDETRFNIAPGRKGHSEIGTNAEVTLEWAVTSDISCRSRFFAFTNYTYFQSDLETTWNFNINRFLSTQLYAHLRYDGSSELIGSKWKHWMLKEILSFGLTYTFSTKP